MRNPYAYAQMRNTIKITKNKHYMFTVKIQLNPN